MRMFHGLSEGKMEHPPIVGEIPFGPDLLVVGGATRSARADADAAVEIAVTEGAANAATPTPQASTSTPPSAMRRTGRRMRQPPIWLIERLGRMKLTWLI
jgi:hypothetical protein